MPLFDNVVDTTKVQAISNDEILTGHQDGTIRLWEVQAKLGGSHSLNLKSTFSGHKDAILHLVSIPSLYDCHFISVSKDDTLKIWRGQENKTLKPYGRAASFSDCESIVLLPDGLIAVSGMHSPAWGGFDIWDIETGKCLFGEQGLSHRPYGMELAYTNGYLAFHPYCGPLSIWKVTRDSCEKVNECNDQRIYSMAVSPKGEIITGGFSLNIYQLSQQGNLWQYNKSNIPNSNAIDAIIPISDQQIAIVDRQGFCGGTVKIADLTKHWGNLENKDAPLIYQTTLGDQYCPTYLTDQKLMIWNDSESKLHYAKLSPIPVPGYSTEQKAILVGQAEIRKWARVFAQAYSHPGNIWSNFPIELTMKIAIFTGSLESSSLPLKYDAKNFFLEHFNSRPPITYYPSTLNHPLR